MIRSNIAQRILKVLAPVLLGILVLFRAPVSASGHAELSAVDPPTRAILSTAPAEMRFWFSEPVERLDVNVKNTGEERIDLGMVQTMAQGASFTVPLRPSLPDGLYRATWEALSPSDGHVTRGTIPFFVGRSSDLPIGANDDETTSSSGGVVGIVGRSLALLGSLVAVGSIWFVPVLHRLMIRTLAGPGLLEMRPMAERIAVVAQVESNSIRQLARIAAAAGLAHLVGLTLILLTESELGGYTIGDWLATSRGQLWLGRAMLGLIIVTVLARCSRPGRESNRLRLWLPLSFAGLVLLAFAAMGSHIRGVDSRPLIGVLSSGLHQVAAALWVGGLVSLRGAVIPALAPLGGIERTRLLSWLIRRFSVIAGASVALVSVSGAYQMFWLLGHPAVLRDETWGRLLALKIVIFVAVLAVAGTHLLGVGPRLRALRSRSDRPARELAAKLRMRFSATVRVEALLLVGLIGVVAALVGSPPGAATVSRGYVPDGWYVPITREASTSTGNLRLRLSPGLTGLNRYDVLLTPPDGQLPSRNTEVALELRSSRTGAIERVPLSMTAPGLFTTFGREISSGGDWSVAVIVSAGGAQTSRATFDVRLAEPTR